MHILIGTNYQAERWPATGKNEGQKEGSELASSGDSSGEDT